MGIANDPAVSVTDMRRWRGVGSVRVILAGEALEGATGEAWWGFVSTFRASDGPFLPPPDTVDVVGAKSACLLVFYRSHARRGLHIRDDFLLADESARRTCLNVSSPGDGVDGFPGEDEDDGSVAAPPAF